MLEAADLEIDVLDFRQRSFQFDRIAEIDGLRFAVFSRTETESESQFRPKLVHLRVAVPLAWIARDEEADSLRIARDGAVTLPTIAEAVVEVGAEPPEFREQGIDWKRAAAPGGALVYAPTEYAGRLLAAPGFAALGLT